MEKKKHLYLSVIPPCFWFDHHPEQCFLFFFVYLHYGQLTISQRILSFLVGKNELKRSVEMKFFKHLPQLLQAQQPRNYQKIKTKPH